MAFYTPAGTKVLNLPEQVQKNLEDIAELKALVGTKQDSSTAVTTANLKESVEAVGSFDLKDISTTSINNTGNLTNAGTADIEGDTNLGSNVEVDGDATLNSPENALFKTGSLDFSELTSFLSSYYAHCAVDKWSGCQGVGCHQRTLPSGDACYILPDPTIGHSFSAESKVTDWNEAFYKAKLIPMFNGSANTDILVTPILADNAILSGWLAYSSVGSRTDDASAYPHISSGGTLYVRANLLRGSCAFADIDWVKRIILYDGYEGKLTSTGFGLFSRCSMLEEIGAFDFSGITSLVYGFSNDTMLKSIHCTHFKVSFNISYSTQFEEADLVEIISNLDTVSTAQTLTIGSTNLAKLTEDEILVATGKGWTLA